MRRARRRRGADTRRAIPTDGDAFSETETYGDRPLVFIIRPVGFYDDTTAKNRGRKRFFHFGGPPITTRIRDGRTAPFAPRRRRRRRRIRRQPISLMSLDKT